MPTILIIEDQPVTRLGVAVLLKQAVKNATFYFSDSYQDGLIELNRRKTDLIVLDIAIPAGSGLMMIKEFRDIQQNVRILAFNSRNELIDSCDYIQHGADGFLHKSDDCRQAENAIHAVLGYKKSVTRHTKEPVPTQWNDHKAFSSDLLKPLSTREHQVLGHLMTGKMTKQIAAELNVKNSTISTQKARIFQKLRVNNIVELVTKLHSYENILPIDI